MNRRSLIKGIIGATAGAFIVPEIIVPERRVWALDRTMIDPRNPSRNLMDDPYFRELYRQMRLDYERALLFGEYDTYIGEYIKNHTLPPHFTRPPGNT